MAVQLIQVMSGKQISVKQAEKWLDKLKTENQQSYRQLAKVLRRYEKTEDDYECYVKMSQTITSHPDLTKELNLYLDEGNKFTIPRPVEEKIKELMSFVKRNRPEIFDKIILLITDLSKSRGDHGPETSMLIKLRIREIVQGEVQLERIIEETLQSLGGNQDTTIRKNLQHLKVQKLPPAPIEEEKEVSRAPPQKNQPERQNNRNESRANEPPKREPRPIITSFSNSSEERAAIRQIEKSVDQQTYQYIIKLTHIYALNIITRNELFDLLANIQIDEVQHDYLKDILDARETERRKCSDFKPLSDMNFSNFERASPSYVSIPRYYPIKCSGKSNQVKLITNDKWVSVPYGSEEGQNFSVRNKNLNEINLIKAEDQRYQFDIYMKKLDKTKDLLEKAIDQKLNNKEKERAELISKVINMGVLQIIFKNCNKDQKQEIQCLLKANDIETCIFFRDKINSQITDLRNIKNVHANKSWSEVASKNFYKAMDLKGFEFKKNEKDRMKGTYFINELQEKSKILENGGEIKNNMITFEDKKDFFTILNSFESSSRSEKCNSRTLPPVESYDLKDERRRHFYPLMILALEEPQTCQYLYSLLIFYIENAQISEPEKMKCKCFLEEFLVNFLGWKLPKRHYLNENFDEQKLYAKIAKTNEEQYDVRAWISMEPEVSVLIDEEKTVEQINLNCMQDEASQYSYLPMKDENKIVIYGSEHLYTLVRFIYALYERLIKMREISEDNQKLTLFELLFFSCIKAKQGIRYEQNLNLLFGKQAYLISTLYKLMDNLVKAVSAASSCILTNYSFKCANIATEDIYFVVMNRFCLVANQTNTKLIRLTYNKDSKVMYFNYLDSYYKSDQAGKEVSKKRNDISKGMDIYTMDYYALQGRKRRKMNEILEYNGMEYVFEGIKMVNHCQHEDILIHNVKKPMLQKFVKRQLKRVNRMTTINE